MSTESSSPQFIAKTEDRSYVVSLVSCNVIVTRNIKGDLLSKNHFSSSSTLIFLNSGCVQTPPVL